MARHACSAGLDGVCDVGDCPQLELFDLTFEVGFGETKAGTDQPPLFLLVAADIDTQVGEIDPTFLGPIEDRRLERLGTHYRAVDFGLREALEIVDDVLVGYFEGSNWCVVALFDDGAQGLGGCDRRGATKGQVASLGDVVFRWIIGVPVDPKGEPKGVATRDRSVLPKAVRVFDLAQMGARLSLHSRHEEIGSFLRVVPGHESSAHHAIWRTGNDN